MKEMRSAAAALFAVALVLGFVVGIVFGTWLAMQ